MDAALSLFLLPLISNGRALLLNLVILSGGIIGLFGLRPIRHSRFTLWRFPDSGVCSAISERGGRLVVRDTS